MYVTPTAKLHPLHFELGILQNMKGVYKLIYMY